MARTSSHFLESVPSFAAASHCFRKKTENVSQSEAVADGITLLPLFFIAKKEEFFIVIFFVLEEEEEREEIIALTGTGLMRIAIMFMNNDINFTLNSILPKGRSTRLV